MTTFPRIEHEFDWWQVPGLAENRPSVLRGDALFVQPADGSSGKREYQGFVHAVEREQVIRRNLPLEPPGQAQDLGF